MKKLLQLLPVILILNFSCQVSKEEEVIKSITTTFVSHQSDTQQKDDKIVAFAKFNVDGSIVEFTQHLTYPYDHAEPKAREFWQSPIQKNVPLIMDGLKLSHAEKIFLYGNDWPKAYAKMIEKKGHPKYPRRTTEFLSTFKTFFIYGSDSIPTEIRTKAVLDNSKNEEFKYYPFEGYLETFEIGNNCVTKYSRNYLINQDNLERLLSKAPDDISKKEMNHMYAEQSDSVCFKYNDDRLLSVVHQNKEHKFIYENSKLVKSEYYIDNKLYNQRFFYYNEDGSKSRTELFNIDNEPEYTINYKYEFFES